jgi:hypothetical protein
MMAATLLIAPLAALAVLGVAAAVLALQRGWQRRLLGSELAAAGSDGSSREAPDILYFTGENCTVCHVAQRPALRRLRDAMPDVTIREIDIATDREAARTYRVMTLPTTIVLNARGTVTAVNVGFTGEAELRGQVEAARVTDSEPAVA